MSNYEIYRNNVIREFVDFSSRMHINCIRHDPNTSDKHKDRVEDICRILRKNKIDFICRPIMERNEPYLKTITFKNIIPDILAFTEPKSTIIEVIDSETEEHVQEKLKTYPDEFRKVFYRTEEKLFELDII